MSPTCPHGNSANRPQWLPEITNRGAENPVIELRIETGEPSTGRCPFCWRRQDVPEAVQATVFVDGEAYGIACLECLSLDDPGLRNQIRETAAHLEGMARDLLEGLQGQIRRPAADVLTLERQYRMSPAVVLDRIVPG